MRPVGLQGRSPELKRIDFGNDPAAGSPTATLLRLLLLLAAEY